jgi:hypothetical protein
MGVFDTVRTAVGPVIDAVEGVERQQDDTPGGGAVDETGVFSPSLFVSSLTGGVVSDEGAQDAGLPSETTVDDLGDVLDAGVGAGDEALEDVSTGLQGESGGGSLGALGRALRWVARNPALVAGGLLVLYLAPLAANALGVLDGVVGE